MKSALIQSIREMPPDRQQELEDFVMFLVKRSPPSPRRKLRQDWAGALREFKKSFSAIELQKKAQEWRNG